MTVKDREGISDHPVIKRYMSYCSSIFLFIRSLFKPHSHVYRIENFLNAVTYCIGFIDFVSSTITASSLNGKSMTRYYQIPLNELARIVEMYGGQVIKNTGDGLFFFFPFTCNTCDDADLLQDCIECALHIIEAQPRISRKMQEEKLPIVDFRVSLDVGEVFPMQTTLNTVDMIGNVINNCRKINSLAGRNGIILGENLYHKAKGVYERFPHASQRAENFGSFGWEIIWQ